MRLSALPLLCTLALAGCGTPDLGHPPVPPTLSENVPAPPRSAVTLIWQPGHFDWNGRQYTWKAGEWVERGGHGTLWQDGYWKRVGSTSVWVPAGWL